ncbi:hypothetical protein MTBUT4_470028 [Magnetospirillum sp. UT-4]|nr:hypothetical protein MTBUT4_470028 [Magnetospirillum sp. UT-4]
MRRPQWRRGHQPHAGREDHGEERRGGIQGAKHHDPQSELSFRGGEGGLAWRSLHVRTIPSNRKLSESISELPRLLSTPINRSFIMCVAPRGAVQAKIVDF